ncbi:hypothetical protein MTP04_07930 [Lysinibacillus sp. PLM2]|nr:hypothetical protein MTP04_07930 [Lysinibacillus sp. PLM2]
MKLLFAHDHTFYKYGDQYFSTGGLSKKMLERYTKVFDEVTVISRQKILTEPNNNLTLASTDRVKFLDIPNIKSLNGLLKYNLAQKKIEQEVKKCDYLISRLPSSIGALAISKAKKLNKPYLIELVACPWDELWNHSLKGKIIAPYNYFKTKKLVGESKYVLYVTNKFLQLRYPTSGLNINCSNVSLKDIDSEVLKGRISKICLKNNSTKIILGTTAAVNVKYKGQQYIIEALGKLKKEGITNYEYQLVGGGDITYLKSIAEKNDVLNQIKFLGLKKHDEVYDWLDSIDIYAQPSRQEGLPRALIEAMSRGIPSLGANTAGIPELLEEEFIFSNSKKNILEIVSILNKFLDISIMKKQAIRNFEESKKYQSDIIEFNRITFFNRFIEENNKQ